MLNDLIGIVWFIIILLMELPRLIKMHLLPEEASY